MSFDPVVYGLCRDEVVDLTRFQTSTGYSFNDIVLTLLWDSIAANGAMQKIQFYDTDGGMKTALSECGVVYLKSVVGESEVIYPAYISRINGMIDQLGGAMTFWLNGEVVNTTMCFVFYNNSTDGTGYVASKVVYRDE